VYFNSSHVTPCIILVRFVVTVSVMPCVAVFIETEILVEDEDII
jgi:hypothetical protein